MSKFIKHIEFKKDEIKSSYVDKLKSQPNCGDAIYNVKGNGIDKIVFASNSKSFGKKDSKLTDSIAYTDGGVYRLIQKDGAFFLRNSVFFIFVFRLKAN